LPSLDQGNPGCFGGPRLPTLTRQGIPKNKFAIALLSVFAAVAAPAAAAVAKNEEATCGVKANKSCKPVVKPAAADAVQKVNVKKS
jgi:hypothetical protein